MAGERRDAKAQATKQQERRLTAAWVGYPYLRVYQAEVLTTLPKRELPPSGILLENFCRKSVSDTPLLELPLLLSREENWLCSSLMALSELESELLSLLIRLCISVFMGLVSPYSLPEPLSLSLLPAPCSCSVFIRVSIKALS